jgi:hypothetical protein
MAALLGWCMVIVMLYCLARWSLPALRAPGHRDLVAWHGLMAAVMAAMLLVPLARSASAVALGVFAAGLGWSVFRIGRRVSRRAYLRLGVGCAAMSAMLLPVATAAATPADAAAGSHHGMHGHAGHGAPDPGVATGQPWLDVPTSLLVVLVVAVGLVLVASACRLAAGSGPIAARVDASCEAVMAVAMGYMLLLMA